MVNNYIADNAKSHGNSLTESSDF